MEAAIKEYLVLGGIIFTFGTVAWLHGQWCKYRYYKYFEELNNIANMRPEKPPKK